MPGARIHEKAPPRRVGGPTRRTCPFSAGCPIERARTLNRLLT